MLRLSFPLFAASLWFAVTPPAASPQTPNAVPLSQDQASSVPRLVQFAGTLRDAAARPVSGVASVTFAIYAEQDGGVALWSETQNVTADASGRYNAALGSATAGGVPEELFGTGQSRWLGVQLARQAELPRVLLVSVPYALKAADADTLGGLPASAYVTTQSLAATKAATANNTTVIAATAPQSSPDISQASPQTSASGVTPDVTLTGSGTAGYLPLWTSASNLSSSGIFQASNGFLGIGTTTPATGVDIANNMIVRGGFTMPPEGTATASTSFTSHSYYFQASAFNSAKNSAALQSFQWQAIPEGNNTATPSGFLNLRFAEGSAPSVSTGFGIASNGLLTFAPGQTFPGNSATLNEVNLPNTSSSTVGVINLGGTPFLSNYGTNNVFVGTQAGGAFQSTGTVNTAVGGQALFANTTGSGNTALGADSLGNNTTGNSNTATGIFALQANTTGAGNVASGYGALVSNTTGNGNVAFGGYALEDNSAGGQNTAVGASAGASVKTGASNTFLGVLADVTGDPLTNATAIGANAAVGESNALVLGSIGRVNGATTSVNVGIGTTTPRYALDVYDTGSGTVISGTAYNNGGAAVLGINNGTAGGSNGGYFATYSPEGTGVVGVSFVGGLAGYFGGNVQVAGSQGVSGNLNIAGTLTKGGGSFKIDDPIAPAEKYLSHSFVESPDMMNIYNGTVLLNAHGQAIIELPAWFGALNRDFRYQLTAIGRSGPGLYIAEKVHDNHFKIAGGKPGLEVSWQVTGIRQDAWANAHRIPTEEEKPPSEQGRYLHPELFGATEDQRIFVGNLPNPAAAPAATQASENPEHKSRQPGSQQ